MAIVSSSAFWGSSYTPYNNNSTMRKNIARVLNRNMNRKDRELLLTLLGVAPGAAALASYARVAHNTTELGGVRTIETVNLVNRVSAAADVTDLAANLLAYNSNPTTSYVTDKADLA